MRDVSADTSRGVSAEYEPPTGPAEPAPISTAVLAAGPPDEARAQIAAAVTALPFPAGDAAGRYGLAKLTVSWLLAQASDHTRRAYFRHLSSWLDWCHRTGLDPRHARRADVDDWTSQLTITSPRGQVRPAAPATRAQSLAAVSSWYAYLESNDACDRNPARAASRPRNVAATVRKAVVLSEAETSALLHHAEARAARLGSEAAWRDAALVAVLFYTGVRVSGVTGADLADLADEAGYRVLRYRVKGGGRSYVRVDGEVTRPLGHYLRLRAARLGATGDQLTGPLLATTPHPHIPGKAGGKRLTQRDVTNTLRTLARQAGLPAADTLTPHSGRGTVVTTLLGRGVDLTRVQDLVDHADPRTTRGYDATDNRLARSPVTTLTEAFAAHRNPPHPGKPTPDTGVANLPTPQKSTAGEPTI